MRRTRQRRGGRRRRMSGPSSRGTASTVSPTVITRCRAWPDAASRRDPTGWQGSRPCSLTDRAPQRHVPRRSRCGPRAPGVGQCHVVAAAVPSGFRAGPPRPTAAVLARTGQRHRVPFPKIPRAAMASGCNRNHSAARVHADVFSGRGQPSWLTADRSWPLSASSQRPGLRTRMRNWIGWWLRPAYRPSRRAPAAACVCCVPTSGFSAGRAWFEWLTDVIRRRRLITRMLMSRRGLTPPRESRSPQVSGATMFVRHRDLWILAHREGADHHSRTPIIQTTTPVFRTSHHPSPNCILAASGPNRAMRRRCSMPTSTTFRNRAVDIGASR